MKKSDEKKLGALVEKATEALEAVRLFAEELHAAEQATWEVKSERWQESEKGESAQELIDTLQELVETAEEAKSNIANLLQEASNLD